MLADGTRVASTGVPVRTTTPRASSRRLTALNSVRSGPQRTSSRRKRTKAVRSGGGSRAAKPQNRQKLALSSNASTSHASDRALTQHLCHEPPFRSR